MPIVPEPRNASLFLSCAFPVNSNNVVTNFTQSLYTSTFEYLDGQTFEESALTGSFAKIQISNLNPDFWF
jgi:hypothetical protein